MGSLDKLETTLGDVFEKHVPVKIPEEGRKGIAHALWWIALIFGILDLWAAYQVWHWGHLANQTIELLNSTLRYYGGDQSLYHLGFFYYLALAVIALVGAMLLFAAPALKAMKKSGWNLLFYAMLIEAAAAILRLFVNSAYGGGFGNFLMSALFALIGAYLLFQVRGQFTAAQPADHKAVTTPPAAPKK